MVKTVLLFFVFSISFISFGKAQDSLPHKRPKVGLVLSGGGAKGFAHIGVLKVLEKAGMPIDFIGGTSMGSIIGGLYSIGYSPDSIEKMVAGQNCPELLTDRFPRKYLSFEEKENDGKYFIPFPINDGKFQLPIGVIPAQNLELLLSRLTWNANDIKKFNLLPIPFICMASDIERGQAVVIDSGTLPKAIRASMAIPTLFTPIKLNNTLLVDGGVYNNFPVDVIKKMGADIIIGVDVGFEPFKGNDLNSMFRITEQTVFLFTIEDNKKKQKECKIFIKPKLRHFNMMSFESADSIIAYGTMAAEEQYAQIKSLADSIKLLGNVEPPKKLKDVKSIDVDEIDVEGNKNVPTHYILSKMNLKVPSTIIVDDLEEAIMRVYGTLLFKKVSYRIEPSGKSHKIIIETDERSKSIFSVGINYNTDYYASIYLNSSFYNLLRPGSKLLLDALLGQNPKLDATYFIFSGWNPTGKGPTMGGWRFDFGMNLNTSHYQLFDYINHNKISSFGYSDIGLNIFAQTVLRNSYALGFGVQNQLNSLKADINPFNKPGSKNRIFNLYAYAKFDTYNHTYFPNEGVRVYAESRYLSKLYDNSIPQGLLLNGSYSAAIPLLKNLSVIPSVYSGLSIADSVPDTYNYRIGGISTYYVKNAFPFFGYKLLEYNPRNFFIARFDVQYEIFRKNYIVFKGNYGWMAPKPEKLITGPQNIVGCGLSYGYNSLVGPIELTVMGSKDERVSVYLNVGFWF